MRPLLPLLAVALLAACQSGAPAQRAAVPAVQPVMPGTATAGACWARDTVAQAAGREERLFAVPCPEVQTQDFVASVQRALAVRGLYAGPVNGRMDAETRRAVRAYQAPQGLDSDILTLDAARQLGLVAIARPAF